MPHQKFSLLKFLTLLYLALFSLWLFFRLFFYDAHWLLALINDSTIYYFAPLLILIPLAIIKKRTRLLLALTIPLLTFLLMFGSHWLPKFPIAATSTFKVMTFNTLYNNPDLDAFVATVTPTAPDILGMQEVSEENAALIESRLAAQFPYRLVQPVSQYNGISLVSKFPIQDHTFLPDPPFQRGIRATVLVNNTPISVYVVHLAAPNMLSYPREEFVSIAGERYTSRRAQVTYLRDEIAKRTLPTLLLCDCNMSDASWTWAVMDKVLNDSYVERGWGLGFSIMSPMPIPTERYDYVWHSPELKPLTAAVGAYGGSDHLPVFVTFQTP